MDQQDRLQDPEAFHVLLMLWQSVQATGGKVWETEIGQTVHAS